MNFETFDEAIDYAVMREREAIEFYQELGDLVAFKERRDFIKDLERMEMKHIEILENIRAKGAAGVSIPKVKDLDISSTVIKPEPAKDMSYQDILIMGMKKEEEAMNLYESLADKSGDGEMKKVFLKLAGEETKHKKFFETLYDEEILTEN